jgi:hypothetical protein
MIIVATISIRTQRLVAQNMKNFFFQSHCLLSMHTRTFKHVPLTGSFPFAHSRSEMSFKRNAENWIAAQQLFDLDEGVQIIFNSNYTSNLNKQIPSRNLWQQSGSSLTFSVLHAISSGFESMVEKEALRTRRVDPRTGFVSFVFRSADLGYNSKTNHTEGLRHAFQSLKKKLSGIRN